jgi:hypothetical protein
MDEIVECSATYIQELGDDKRRVPAVKVNLIFQNISHN